MDFFSRNLRETLEAINKLIDNNISLVTTKSIRRCNNIKASNRSKINFIWRSLNYLEKEGILEMNGRYSPKTYKIKSDQKIDIDDLISQIEESRK
ncbi:MAG: hypothetical protein E3J90_09370 [Promethearchaeota archaeon]|nr:MAG: hypothetical protein E3J90_09370 [Candidatus Lokiarchaeota archaeon]